MKETEMPIVGDVLGTVGKIFVRELEELEIGGRAEIIQITASLRSARILRLLAVIQSSNSGRYNNNLTPENLDRDKKRKPLERNGISPNSSTKPRKKQSYQSEHRKDATKKQM